MVGMVIDSAMVTKGCILARNRGLVDSHIPSTSPCFAQVEPHCFIKTDVELSKPVLLDQSIC
ncbi:hypothetical protein JZ751_015121 [Albula glossodonta]|uniref:Uncharacterized protein n=1 Tax=Albula glossodonta TaxID=121402 RepID=A0A8T2NRB5_9TELE|nr:hypothetical protein JZ751_015121 [Albula glossodonta]